VKQGVYPKGTKVKLRRLKHSDVYTINMFMPNVQIPDWKHYSQKELKKAGFMELSKKIGKIANEMGYEPSKEGDDEHIVDGPSFFHEDVGHLWNYGIDRKGELRYIDTEVLQYNFPFKGRKSFRQIQREDLERRVSLVVGVAAILFSLFFLSPAFTGNAIANLTTKISDLIGAGLFVLGIIVLAFLFKKK